MKGQKKKEGLSPPVIPPLGLPEAKDCKVFEKKKYSRLAFWDRHKLRKSPEKAFLIKMLFSNGTCKEFVIIGKTETFTYNKRVYFLRYEDSWFNITQNQYELTYFDDYPVPIDRKILKQGDKAFWSVTPENLKPLIQMEYVKALATSEELLGKLKALFVFGIVQLCMMGIFLLILFSTRGLIKTAMGVN